MTTNECMNRGRYKHFQANGGKSPFSRGFINNVADFFGVSICGIAQPKYTDWMRTYHPEQNDASGAGANGGGGDRWKYV